MGRSSACAFIWMFLLAWNTTPGSAQQYTNDPRGYTAPEIFEVPAARSLDLISPLNYGAAVSTGEDYYFSEYGYDQGQQILITGPLYPIVAYKRLYGYRHGPYYGFGAFLDVPPFTGFGVVRDGFGPNPAADLLAMMVQYEGHKTARAGPAYWA